MLGKLIKTDLKSTARGFIPVCAGLLILAIAMIICVTAVPEGTSDVANASFAVAYLIYSLTLIVFTGLAFIIPVQRFKRCILNNDAYLMLTIPVHPWMHVISKLVCSIIWYIAAQICRLIVTLIMFANDEDFKSVMGLFMSVSGKGDNKEWIWQNVVSFFSTLLLIILAQLFLYMVYVISSMFNKNRGVITVLLAIFGIVILSWGYGMVMVLSYRVLDRSAGMFSSFYIGYRLLICAYYAVCSIVFYIATTLILGKKYNLQ